MPKIKLRFAPYMRGEPEWREVEAKVIGDLAVHRSGFLSSDDGEISFGKSWQVSHIPTGDTVAIALPDRFWDRGGVRANQRDLLAWAAAFQQAAPEFFAAARIGDQIAMLEHVAEARRFGKAL